MSRAVRVMLSAVSANETYLSFFVRGPSRFFRSRSHRYSSSWSRDIAQLGSAPRSGRGGRGFESRYPDHRTVPQQRSGEVAALLHSPAAVRNVMGARCLNGSAPPICSLLGQEGEPGSRGASSIPLGSASPGSVPTPASDRWAASAKFSATRSGSVPRHRAIAFITW